MKKNNEDTKTCISCIHAIEQYEDVNGETFLVRYCELNNNHIEDDNTCELYE